MAEFFIRADPDPERRAAHDAGADSYLDDLPYSIRHEWAAGKVSTVVLRNEETPYSTVQEEGKLIVAVGDESKASLSGDTANMSERGPLEEPPDQLYRRWSESAPFGFMAYIQSERSVFVAADRLGLFPVYYFRDSDVLLAASSPSLIVCHPSFRHRVDRVGLTGILLYSFPSGRRTLWEHIGRLSSGHAVELSTDGSPREHEVWTPPEKIEESVAPREAARRFDTELKKWSDSIGESVNLQLSGGLDSRVVTGYLAENPTRVKEAWTYGHPRDIEAQVARSVAARCSFAHDVVPVDTSRYLDWAYTQIESSHLTNAVPDLATWALAERGASDNRRVVSGHLGDIVMGGNHLGRALGTDVSPEEAFSVICTRLNEGYGLDKEAFHQVVRGEDTEELIRACESDLYGSYTTFGATSFRRGWYFDLFHRDRLNIGRLILQTARFSWPELPYCMPDLVEAAAILPARLHRGRNIQKHILRAQFPELASLPLTRGTFDTWPLNHYSEISRWWWRVREGVAWRWRKGLYDAFGIDRRVNHRFWNANQNPGWRSIRREAREWVHAAGDLFNEEVFLDLIPPPEEPIDLSNPLKGMGRKTLMGLVLWARRFL